MDEALVTEMLNEIEAMTSDEYWELFNMAQKLPDSLADGESAAPSPAGLAHSYTNAHLTPSKTA
jgi:hypothetical protein